MFDKCYILPDISKWDTSNVNNMTGIFSCCQDIPDISNCDTSNVNNMSYMFYHCAFVAMDPPYFTLFSSIIRLKFSKVS